MKIGFIGMGNMATAIASGVISSGFEDGKNIYAYDVDENKIKEMNSKYAINGCKDEIDLVNSSDVIIFAVKPNIIEKVISKIKEALKNKMVISIVAGYSNDKYNELLDSSTHHLTIMPNTPALVKQGMTLFEKDNTLTQEELAFSIKMFESVGSVEIIENYQMKAGGALTGCGPAFIYMMIEALADGAVLEGLPRAIAYKLASQMVLGSATMVKETGLHPGILKDQVCSPGGITIKGVKALEDNHFRSALMEAISKSK